MAVAWDVPETSFQKMMETRGRQCPCVVCLMPMFVTAFMPLEMEAQRSAIVKLLGHEPGLGRIEVLPTQIAP